MKLDNHVIERIKCINWFENCGRQVNWQIDIPITYVNSWEDAKENYQLPDWENTTLEARNELTSFLYSKFRTQYSNWNQLVRDAKKFLDVEVIPKINVIKEKNNLDQIFIDCVKWDIMNAIMEGTFKDCNLRKAFFLDLLTIYESGNFPCGWNGKWPEGSVLVY